MVKKLFMFLLFGLFLISFVAASVDFSEEEDIYIIDTIWPTWLGGNGLSTVKLIDNTDTCLIDCYFILEFNNEKPVNLLEDISFIDESERDASHNIEKIKFKIGRYEDVKKTISTYEEVCDNQFVLNNQTGLNETKNICSQQQTGNKTYIENEIVWSDYFGEKVDGINYLKANAKKKINKKVDWIIRFRGEDLMNWAWWNANWNYKKNIIINSTVSSTLTNFPSLMRLDTATLISAGKMNNDCGDLRVLNSLEDTEFSFEIENGTCNTNETIVWFKHTSLSNGNQSVYAYYGNSLATDGQSIADVWSNGYFAVYHFGGNMLNSIGTNANLTEYGVLEYNHDAGLGLGYNGSNTGNYGSSLNLFDPDNYNSGFSLIAIHESFGATGLISPIFYDASGGYGSGGFFTNSNGNLDITFGDGIADQQGDTFFGNNYASIIKMATSHNVSKNVNILGNGTVSIKTTNTMANNLNDWEFFRQYNVQGDAFGTLTEARLSTVERTSDWLLAELRQVSYEGSEENANSLLITEISPIDYYNSTSNNVAFECNLSDETGGLSLNLTINGSVYETITGAGSTNLSLSSTETLSDGFYEWYCTGNDDTETKNSTIRYLTVDTTAPTITTATNLTDIITLTLPTNSTWSFNASDIHLDSCYYNTTDQNTTIVTCNSTIQTQWATQGNKTIISCANDTLGLETCQTDYIWVYYIEETQSEDLDPVGEGTEVTFNFTVNMTNIPSTTAYIVLNNTNYAATTSQAGTNGYYFERAVTIPDGWGSTSGNVIDWNWVYNITGVTTNENTDTTNITIYELAIDNCSSYGDIILNISLKDEAGNSFMFSPNTNETLIEVDLLITAKDDTSLTWQYSNSWNNDADGIVQVCIPTGILTNSQYRLDYTMGFNAESYVQEFHYLDNGTLDDTEILTPLTNKTTNLYDLLLADSTTFLFKFYDTDGLEVSDGLVHVFRKYIGDGLFREVERSKQDNNGETHLHLVEEDVIYYFKVSLDGQLLYTSSTYNAKCLSNPCQIELEASGDFTQFNDSWNLADGTYDVNDNPTTRIVTLSYALEDPEYMNLTIFKYTNNPNTMEIIGSDQAYSTGGTLSVTIPQVAGNVSFIAAVYQNGDIIDTTWVDFNESGRDYFGATGVFMALLLLISLILMANSEKEGTLIFAIIGLILISTLKLIDLDYYALVGFICAAIILIWKLSRRRNRR